MPDPAPLSTDVPDFDPTVLAALPMVLDGSAPDFAREVLQLYEQASVRALAAIAAALAAGSGQAQALLRELHTLKSGSAQVGAMRLAELAGRFEADLRAGRAAHTEWSVALREAHARARHAWRHHGPPRPAASGATA